MYKINVIIACAFHAWLLCATWCCELYMCGIYIKKICAKTKFFLLTGTKCIRYCAQLTVM